jgi:hypothetical protein
MADIKPLKIASGIIQEVGTGDTIPVANGGTGKSTLTDNGVLIGNGTGAIDVTSAGTTGQVLVGVTGGNPAFGSSFIGSSIAVYKSADETVTTSNTLQNDNELLFPIGANETWKGFINTMVTANASGGYKFDMTAPSGATGSMMTKSSVANYNHASVGIGTGGGSTTGATVNNTNAIHYFTVTSSSTTGNVQFRWSQNASFGTGTTVAAGSLLMATRIA